MVHDCTFDSQGIRGEEENMKKAIISVSSLALVLTLVPAFSAAQSKAQPKAAAVAPESVIYDEASVMAFLRTLSGEWQAGADEHGAAPRAGSYDFLSFKTKAAGSAVVQTASAGQPGNEMETIFHMDGDQLLLTHYCVLQNAPVLQFQKSSKPGEIKFVFKGGTNFDPKVDAHLHEATFQVKDKNTVERHITAFANGKPNPEGVSILKRKQSQE
jgi:hypothetical protein